MDWSIIIVGGHTRGIGKTQLVCDVIAAFPDAGWIAGKITQYGHGVCAQNGNDCDCAPEDHVCAIEWETDATSGTDTSRFLRVGAKKSFWLRTKQGYLAEGLPLLRKTLTETLDENCREPRPLIIESNSLLQFVKPTLYLAVIDPTKDDFKDSARAALDRADALVIHESETTVQREEPTWMKLPAKLLREKPSIRQRISEPLPEPLQVLVQRVLEGPRTVSL